MQTRSQKKITPSEERAALEMITKPKKTKKGSAPAVKAARKSKAPPPRKKARRNSSTLPADAPQDASPPPQSKTSARESSVTAPDAPPVPEVVPPKKKPAKKQAKKPATAPQAGRALPPKKKAGGKRAASLEDVLPQIEDVPANKRPGRKRKEPPTDAADDVDVPPPIQNLGKQRSTPFAEAPPDIDAPPPTAKSPRKRSLTPVNVIRHDTGPPAKRISERKGSTPPADAAEDTDIPSPKETSVRKSSTLPVHVVPANMLAPAKKSGRKRSASADASVPPPKKKKSPKAVRFENEELTPVEESQKILDDIAAEFSNGLTDKLLEELNAESVSSEDSVGEIEDLDIVENVEEEEWDPLLEEEEEEEEEDPQLIEQNLLEEEGAQEIETQQPKLQNPPHTLTPSPTDRPVITNLPIKPPTKPPMHPQDALIKSRYHALKALAWAWTTTHFSPTSPSSLNLSRLADTSPQLMEYVNYISSCGPNSWEYVFNEQRSWLVYGILGKMLEVHVVGSEMFGGREEEVEELRGFDAESYLEDGFLRQRHRSAKIRSFHIPPSPSTPASPDTPDTPATPLPTPFTTALSTLHASFLSLLSPLLPAPSLLPSTKTQTPTLSTSLSTILHNAATLSLSIRTAPNTIYHWQTHPAIGTLFQKSEMHILNWTGTYNPTAKLGRKRGDVEVVTMVGWPGCVAYREIFAGGGDEGREGPVRIAKAEVMVGWGRALGVGEKQAGMWLGPRLRVEMERRLGEEREWERGQRMTVVYPGVLVTGTLLAMKYFRGSG